MPTVTELQLFAVDLPFKVAFRHAAASRTTSESLFLRVGLDSGVEGWGSRSRGPTSPASVARGPSPCSVTPSCRRCSGGRSSRCRRSSRSWRNATARHPPSGSAPRSPRRRPGAASTWRCSTRSAGRSVNRCRSAASRQRPTRCGDIATAGWCPPAGVALCGVAAQDAGLPVPARQAEGRTGRGPAGGQDGAAAARPPGRPPGGRQHGLGRRAGVGGHRPAARGRDPVVRAADPRRRPGRPGPAGGRVGGRDRGR